MNVLDLFKLDNRIALVTGVGRGIGQAIAVGLAEAGANIVGLYQSRYEETQNQVEALGRRFLPIQCDLSSATQASLNEVVYQSGQELGGLHILINNAGIIRRAPVLEFTEADWDEVVQVNLKSIFFLSQAAAKVMAENGGGKIVHVASLLSFQGGILVPAYTAAKHAVAGLTKSMANEWAALNININAIAPGYIRTDNTATLQQDPQRRQAILDRIPAGRWGEPEDIKGLALYLSSPASDYMNGAVVLIDGGWMGR